MLELLESLHMEKSSTSQPNFPYVVKREECFLQSTIEVSELAWSWNACSWLQNMLLLVLEIDRNGC